MTRYTLVFEWPDDKAPSLCGSETFLGGTLCLVRFDDGPLPDALCVWEEDDDGAWRSECGHVFEIVEGGPVENDMQHCCFCGRVLIERRKSLYRGPGELERTGYLPPGTADERERSE